MFEYAQRRLVFGGRVVLLFANASIYAGGIVTVRLIAYPVRVSISDFGSRVIRLSACDFEIYLSVPEKRTGSTREQPTGWGGGFCLFYS